MKIRQILFTVAISMMMLCAAYSQATQAKAATNASASEKAFLGRWNLTLKAPDREYPSWLELSVEGGQLKAQMVGRWGNARPLPRVELAHGKLTFVSP